MNEVYLERFAQVAQWLQQQGLAAGLITAPVSMKYLTGWSNPSKRFSGLMIPASGEPVLIVPTLELAEARHGAVRILANWTDGEDPFALLATVLTGAGAGGGRMAVEKESLTLRVYERMAAGLGLAPAALLAGLGDLTPVISGMRERKSQAEVDLMQRAADVLVPALDAALLAIKPGITEKQLAAVIEEHMTRAGAEGFAFETHVLFGAKAALPHGSTGDQVLAEGQVVLMDFGAMVGGYRSDITRTVACGEWTPTMAQVYEVVRAANEAAIAAVRPGVSLGEIDRAARAVIEQAGFGEYFIHRTGHGLGLEVHEEPYVVGGNPKLLEPGHVVTIEPGIYLPAVGGVRIEDDVVVTGDGCRVLTSFTKARIAVG